MIDMNTLIREQRPGGSANVPVLDDQFVPGSGEVTHTGIDLSLFKFRQIYVRSTSDCTIYYQGSDDGDNWYNLKTGDDQGAEDADFVWTCDNEGITFCLNDTALYVRLYIINGSTDNTISASISGII